MTSTPDGRRTPATGAARLRLGLVGLLLALAAGSWWWTTRQMQGMDDGPWTGLGTLGWFLVVWVVMMAAMMLPSVAPTVALYARMTRQRFPAAPLLFTAGYLLTWAAPGLLAFALAHAASRVFGDALGWDRVGRPLAGATLLVAAAYELTPLKDVCLGKCRSPLASLFALGVMSVVWMGAIAGLIALEKTLPWRRTATYATAALLVLGGVLLLAAPGAIPTLTVPATMPGMAPAAA